MKDWWRFIVILIAGCLAFAMIVACGDDDDDDDATGDDDDATGGDDDATGGDDCQSMCERGFQCFGDDYYDYFDGDTLEECVQVCETDLSDAEPELAECIFGCANVSGCDEWVECMSECAGY